LHLQITPATDGLIWVNRFHFLWASKSPQEVAAANQLIAAMIQQSIAVTFSVTETAQTKATVMIQQEVPGVCSGKHQT
jgi:hypothetical protein